MAEKHNESTGYDVEASNSNQGVELNLANDHDQLERGLKSRHIQFLALGMSQYSPCVVGFFDAAWLDLY
jgi:yeast amino acid transporter